MNKNIVIGGLVVLVLIAGVVYYMTTGTDTLSPTATSTPDGSTGTAQTPKAPTVFTSTTASPTDTTAVVTGSITPNGAFTNYWYEFGTTANLGSKTNSQSIGSGYTAIPAPIYITGLTKSTTYYFRLVAENQYGTNTGATQSFVTSNGVPAPTGSVPSVQTIAANGITRTGATLNGSVLPNKAATTYWFEYGKTATLGSVTAFQSAGSGTATLSASATLSGLDPDTSYSFRLNAQNQFGTVIGPILTFKTQGPAVVTVSLPTVITRNSSNIASTSATVHGTVTQNGAATTYWFEYSTNALLPSTSLQTTSHTLVGSSTGAVAVTADLTGLARTTTYYFRLVAQNSSGTSKGDSESFKTK